MGKNDYHKLMNRSEKSVERRLKKVLSKKDKEPIDERLELLEDRILELEAENERLKNGQENKSWYDNPSQQMETRTTLFNEPLTFNQRPALTPDPRNPRNNGL